MDKESLILVDKDLMMCDLADRVFRKLKLRQ